MQIENMSKNVMVILLHSGNTSKVKTTNYRNGLLIRKENKIERDKDDLNKNHK